MTLLFNQDHYCVSNLTNKFNLYYNSNISDCGIQIWHGGRLMHGMLYAHARLDGLHRGARSQWVGKGNKSALNYLAKLNKQ